MCVGAGCRKKKEGKKSIYIESTREEKYIIIIIIIKPERKKKIAYTESIERERNIPEQVEEGMKKKRGGFQLSSKLWDWLPSGRWEAELPQWWWTRAQPPPRRLGKRPTPCAGQVCMSSYRPVLLLLPSSLTE